MPNDTKLDPTGERAAATEAMESTPISGKEHEYRADGDHRPRQDAVAGEGGQTEAGGEAASEPARPISEGIPGAGRTPETGAAPDAQRERGPRA